MGGWNRTWIWAVWEVQKHFCNHLLRAYVSVCVATVSLPQMGRFIAKAVVLMCYFFTHPLCALSAFESLVAPRLLLSSEKGPSGSWAESVFWALFQERPRLHFHQRTLLARVLEHLLSGMFSRQEDHIGGPIMFFTTVP